MNKIVLILTLFFGISAKAQNEKSISGRTLVDVSFYHLGSYAKERPFVFLEQEINFSLHPKFTFGLGTGINVFPGALGLPLKLRGTYNFNRNYIFQTVGAHLKVGTLFFSGYLWRGGYGRTFTLGDQLVLNSDLGYSYGWDRYGGKRLSFYLGIGLSYNFKTL
ncbi:MAG: hypothetical protein MK078_09670 [Crocinitomicaceae bacterium]|nr:hypothetical protein [Crocinitomicaceae bacterium]